MQPLFNPHATYHARHQQGQRQVYMYHTITTSKHVFLRIESPAHDQRPVKIDDFFTSRSTPKKLFFKIGLLKRRM